MHAGGGWGGPQKNGTGLFYVAKNRLTLLRNSRISLSPPPFASRLEDAQDWEKAVSYYREVRVLLSKRGDRLSPDVLVNLCLTKLVRALIKDSHASEAVNLAGENLKIHKSPETYLSLGEAMTGAEKFEDAVRTLKDGVNQFPER